MSASQYISKVKYEKGVFTHQHTKTQMHTHVSFQGKMNSFCLSSECQVFNSIFKLFLNLKERVDKVGNGITHLGSCNLDNLHHFPTIFIHKENPMH